MVHASNPRLMNRVLDVVVHLCDGKGSTAQDILDFLRQTSKSTPRNLTMQVHRALKHAVNAGLLRHRSGRYKSLFMLKPVPVKQSSNENNGEKLANETKEKYKPPSRVKKEKGDNRTRHRKQRRERGRKRSRSGVRRRKRRSGSGKQDEPKHKIGKPKYKEKGESGWSPRHKISNSRLQADIGNASSSSNRKRSKARPRDSSSHSDLSDCSDYESRKAKARTRDPASQERKQDGNGREDRSVSRNCSPHRQQSQQSQQSYAKRCNDDDKTNQLNTDDGKSDEVDPNTGKDHESNNSGSNSS